LVGRLSLSGSAAEVPLFSYFGSMNPLLVEILIIFLLLLANGVFAMAEISVVSSRRARLKKLADDGSTPARIAFALAEEPTRFLSTVQIGITMVGILAGTFGGATLSEALALEIAKVSWLEPYSRALALAIVVGAITYFSLIIGELVPKRIALNNPERKAMILAGPMLTLSRIASPFVALLTTSTNAVLKVLGQSKEPEAPPSEEEVTAMVEQGTHAGVFHKAERAMVEGVLRLDEQPVTELMTRRSKIVFLDIADNDEVNWRKIVSSAHTNFPVYEGNRDQVIGMVSVKALWANAAIGLKNNLRDHLTTPLFVPETVSAVQVLETFQSTGKQLALVTDEFGTVQGIVTLFDVMRAIVGALPQPGDRRRTPAIQREDGSWLVEGSLGIVDFKRRFSLGPLPGEDDDRFQSLGGFVVDRLGHIPNAGESFHWGGWRFEVVDMDRHRVDKVLLVQSPTQPAA
jgi:putative hemolysin